MIKGMKNNLHERGEGLPGVLIGVMVLFLVGAAFMIGRLSLQVEQLKGGGSVVDKQVLGEAGEIPTVGPQGLSVTRLKSLAGEIGLDNEKFEQCLDQSKYEKKVVDDLNYGGEKGVTGTPTYFINGVMVVGARPQADFEKVIDAEIKNGGGDKIVLSGSSEQLGREKIQTGIGYVKGSASAKVKMVVFSDFECSFCARGVVTERSLLEKYGSQISLEFRHAPLPFHANAQKAAEAAECAGEQGKFWEMHDEIFKLTGS